MNDIYTTGRRIVKDNYASLRDASLGAINSFFSGSAHPWISNDDKKDILENVLCKVLVNGDSYDASKASLCTWVKTIAHNECVNYVRGHRSWEPLEFEDEDGDLFERPELSFDTTPEDETVARETAAACEAGLSGRSPLDRELHSLWSQGWQPRELAEVYGLTPGAVSMRIHKCCAAARDALTDRGRS